ncbi:endonuclease domain-containing protein [Bradyrhizobium sp. A11]|uniref:endonuclease domain-containing protein n=1 Tax=Bradyrhizobium sp. A11 TaxID=3133974 RepID=UPI003249C2E9
MLWRALKELPMDGSHFRRQAPIGPYIVDFFCPAKRLIVELDGGHHNEDDVAARDLERQRWLENEGYRVIRFWNSELSNDLTAVMERVYVDSMARAGRKLCTSLTGASEKRQPNREAPSLTLPWRGRVDRA